MGGNRSLIGFFLGAENNRDRVHGRIQGLDREAAARGR